MTIYKRLTHAAVAATFALISSAPVRADTHAPQTLATEMVIVKSAAGKGTARFDWLQPRKTAAAARIADATSLGTGSWICSPSGFGAKSKCYQR